LDKRPKQSKMGMRFGTCNKRSLYRAGSLTKSCDRNVKYKLHLGGVHVRWDRGGTQPTGEYTFFYGKGDENHELGTGLFVHKRIISAVKSVEFDIDRMS
jgi:hypothetical protein